LLTGRYKVSGQKKIVGVIGSSLIGTDPFDPKVWSGSSKFFFDACLEKGILQRAFGVDAKKRHKYPLMLGNFSPTREVWKYKFYLDTRYYDYLTAEIASRLTGEDFDHCILQIGGIFKVPDFVDGRCKCYSYQDGNLAQLVQKSTVFKSLGIPKSVVDKALKYEIEVASSMDKIFTMSEYLRKSFIDDMGMPPEKVVAIGGGVNMVDIPGEVEKDYTKQNLLFIGIEFERKGGPELLQAFRKVREKQPGAVLHIVGPKKLVIPNHLANGVIYHGFLSKRVPAEREQLEALFRGASLFVMPSHYEPYGIAPLESMLYRIPCVLNDRCAFPEMVTPGVNGELVHYGDVDDMAEKIGHLLGDPELLQTAGNNARQVVLDNFLWKHVVARLSEHL
jgi:glycosyltransferase involved in cell wall biosynthesis